MQRLSFMTGAAGLMFVAGLASAQQMTPPGWSQFNPPLPPPPASPKIEVPVVPKMDGPSQPHIRSSRRSSFSDRVSRCLDEGAAAGLGPSARAAYSRSCANRD